jgi:glyoxylase-like metal-dependent hydrolase (beta-lactamase superfamily II)
MTTTTSIHFALTPLADGVSAAIAAEGGAAIANAGIIDLGGLAIIFDTFMTPQAAKDLHAAASVLLPHPPQVVVNSHYHNDHTWGNQVFGPEVLLVSSKITRELFLTEGKLELEDARANAARRLQGLQAGLAGQTPQQQAAAQVWIDYFRALVDNLPGLRLHPAGLTFSGRLELHGERRSAVLIEYEGAHTGSDTILHLPSEGLAFVSDLLFVGCHPYLGDGDPLRHLAVIAELLALDAERYVPGHGPVGGKTDLRLLADYIEHCLETAARLPAEQEALESELGKLTPPAVFSGWGLANFYRANLRNLANRKPG